MPKRKLTPNYIAAHIRRVIEDGGSAPHASEVQRFFKEEVQSRGWYTAELRKLSVRFRRTLLREMGYDFLLKVADKLFSGSILEEKACAVFLMEKLTGEFGDREFRLWESWLGRVSNWADHDALVHSLIGPMMVDEPRRAVKVFAWARGRNPWRRRAACVALIRGTRKKMFFPQVVKLSGMLLKDEHPMVQKGLGWLLRETVKADPQRGVRYLDTVRERAPRLVLRTAVETLSPELRAKILHRERVGSRRAAQ